MMLTVLHHRNNLFVLSEQHQHGDNRRRSVLGRLWNTLGPELHKHDKPI